MSLNTELDLERMDLEIKIERLLGKLGASDLSDLDKRELGERLAALRQELNALEDLQRRYNQRLAEAASEP